MILNYHHRMADTHNMPEWVSLTFTVFLRGVSFVLSTNKLLSPSKPDLIPPAG